MITNWAVTPEDQSLIEKIGYRAEELAKRLGMVGRHAYKRQDVMMDITATHNNGAPLLLAQLLAAGDGDFAHDVFGIRRWLNRDNGQLMDCFVPRFHA